MNNAFARAGDYLVRAREIEIHVGLIALLAVACFLIVRPFIALIAWGVIIAIAAYPVFTKLTKLLGGRSVVSALIYTLVLLAVLIIPIFFLAGSLVDGVQTFAAKFKAGGPIIPPPPANVETWPVIGVPLKNVWDLASRNLSSVLRNFAPQIKALIPQVFVASAGIGFAVLQCIFSIIVSGVLLASAGKMSGFAASLSNRLFGVRGPEFQNMAAATVRSVTTGILGVALIQSVSPW